jgi:lysozyme family protein
MSKVDLFNRCIDVVLKNEGGYSNHPSDPGGETNFGIAKKFYPDLDIKNLTVNQAKNIYFRDYWSKMNLIDINNEELILQIFDMGINAGIRTAIKIAQRMVSVKDDGIIGNQTLSAINNSQYDLVIAYKLEREEYYKVLVEKKPQLGVFLSGWRNRIINTHF